MARYTILAAVSPWRLNTFPTLPTGRSFHRRCFVPARFIPSTRSTRSRQNRHYCIHRAALNLGAASAYVIFFHLKFFARKFGTFKNYVYICCELLKLPFIVNLLILKTMKKSILSVAAGVVFSAPQHSQATKSMRIIKCRNSAIL